MSAQAQGLGTRFLLYPQSPSMPGYEKPELVWISSPAGSILPGPSNDRMYVIDPAVPKAHYHYPYLPPFMGAIHPPVEPGPDGHWDHIDPGDRAFLGVHAFGCVARVLDVWEGYFGRRINWHFAESYERLEILPLIDWHNAQSGYGMLEFGYEVSPNGHSVDYYALNFDVIAHEVGHSILFSEIGLPMGGVPPGPDWMAYHEGMSDLISLIALLHFDTAIDRVLRRNSGNLLGLNELNRVAELADERQIRVASNGRKMSEVGHEVHDRSRPFTGAVFDLLVQIYHDLAAQRGYVDLPMGSIPDARDIGGDLAAHYAPAFETSYAYRHFALKEALVDARDIVARALARSWTNLNSETLTYPAAAIALCDALQEAGQDQFAAIAYESFAWREILEPFDLHAIGPGPGQVAHWF